MSFVVTGRPDRSSPMWLLAGVALSAVAAGTVTAMQPLVVMTAVVTILVVALVWRHPAAAGVLVMGVTPLVAGIDRGRLFPLIRPNEALVLALCCVLIAKYLLRMPAGALPRLELNRLEWSILSVAVASSVLPLAWMVVRGQPPDSEDISYALVLWKYLAVYVLVRASVRTDRQVRWCLWAGVAAATVVAVLGALQALDLLGMRSLLLDYYAPYGYVGALAQPRGGSTLASPAATADLLIFTAAVIAGLWWKEPRSRPLLLLTGVSCVVGLFSAGVFAGAVGLVVGAVSAALVLGRTDLLKWLPLAIVGASLAVWPVVSERLEGFQTVEGLPVSWTTRLSNLEAYFWPELFSGANLLLGVRPAARVVAPHQGTGYVWIESGHTWLLWGGGLPLFAAFSWFVITALRWMWRRARPLDTWSSVAALGAFTAVAVITVLMTFDPHLTYRGAADALFSLLALALVGSSDAQARGAPDSTTATSLQHKRTGEPV